MTVLSFCLAVALALASAIIIAWGTVVRHRIAATATGKVIRTAMRNPRWWLGTGAAILAYALQLLALRFGTLLIVQPILVLSLMFTLPLAAWYAQRTMPAREVFWAIALTIAVTVVVIYGHPVAGIARPPWSHWWPALLLGLGVLGALFATAQLVPTHRALILGLSCGVIYGYVALLAKAAMDICGTQGLVAMASSWEIWALAGLAATGTVAQQHSFHAGELPHSLPAMTIMEPLVAFGLGYWVLGEKFQVTTISGWSVMAAAVAVMIISSFRIRSATCPATCSVN